jgi:hypothetical protein
MLAALVCLSSPVLVNSAFAVGDPITLATDSRVRVRVWVLPIGFCSPMTHVYLASHSVSDTFTLTDNISRLCLFFDNPSRDTQITASIISRRVNFSRFRVEPWDSALGSVPCTKSACRANVRGVFFLRFVDARQGMRFAIDARFQRHEIQTLCERQPVPVWDANISYTVRLPASRERFYCDDAYAAAAERKRNWMRIIAIASVAALGTRLWIWYNGPPENTASPRAEAVQESLRDDEVFLKIADL